MSDYSFINLGIHYAFGGVAKYYDRDQIKDWDIQLNVSGYNSNQQTGTFNNDDISVSAIPKKSRTDMLLIEGGITFELMR